MNPTSLTSFSSSAVPGLEVRGISKTFGDIAVLRDINFAVTSGEFATILGPSGCGKTTLLRIIAGLELPDQGEVLVAGKSIGHEPASRRPVNTVFQNYALFPHLDVFENVAFGLRSRKFPQTDVKTRTEAALKMLQLEGLARRTPARLSGGQKQRVALARALVNEPEVLLLDEPMSALDAKLRAEVQLELRALQRRLGKTFILVTHDQEEAMTVSDRIIVMSDGKIEQSGPPSAVYARPVSRFVAEFLGSANLIHAQCRGGTIVETPLGMLELSATPGWTAGTLAIRPERIVICETCPPKNGLRVKVNEVIFRGGYVDVFTDPGGIRIRVASGERFESGREFWIEFPVEHLQILG